MGNREALLAGATQCLLEKGFARTTARDIAAASGTSLAAIGYHYGSTQALLLEAVYEATGAWGEHLGAALAAAQQPGDPDPLARFEAGWTAVLETFEANRTLWAASFEMFSLVDHVPGVRERLAGMVDEARLGLAELLSGIDPEADEGTARAVGSLQYALLSGVLVQWLVDPARAPSAHDLTVALRSLTSGRAVGPP